MFNIFFVILVDMIGFGIMIPIFAYYVLQLGGGPEEATFLMALYTLAMFVSAPILGRLSDYYGRKPVLLISMFGAFIGYLILGFADSLLLIALSRLLSGSMAGNIAAAQAYISDITDESNRAKGMGMIGAAFGLGFVIGPAIGSYMAGNNFETANFFLPAMTSAGLSLLSFISIFFFLKESLDDEHKAELRAKPKMGQIAAMKSVLSRKTLKLIIFCGILFNLAAGLFEAIFPIWAKDLNLISGPQGLAPMLLVAGLTLAVVQGGLVGKLTKKFGEHKLLQMSSWLYAFSMVLLIVSGSMGMYWLVLVAMSTQAAASGVMLTSIQSLASLQAARDEKGTVMGTFSSLGTLARTIGTFATGAVYVGFGMQSPLVLTAICITGIYFVTFAIKSQVPVKTPAEAS